MKRTSEAIALMQHSLLFCGLSQVAIEGMYCKLVVQFVCATIIYIAVNCELTTQCRAEAW